MLLASDGPAGVLWPVWGRLTTPCGSLTLKSAGKWTCRVLPHAVNAKAARIAGYPTTSRGFAGQLCSGPERPHHFRRQLIDDRITDRGPQVPRTTEPVPT